MEGNGTGKKVAAVFVALAIAAVGFGGGFLTAKMSRKREVSSFEWALKTVRDNYYQDVPSDKFLNGSLKGMVDECLDIYSAYYTAEEYQKELASNSGRMSGVGISFTYVGENDGNFEHPEGKSGILLERVVGGSPASAAGLKAGEFVLSGEYGDEVTEFDSVADFSAFIDKCDTGENFTLYSDRNDEGYTLAKSAYTASYCYMATAQTEWNISYGEGGREITETESTLQLPDGAAYLRLDQFYGNAAYEMAELIGKFNAENCTSLILDLRGNGGGYVDVMCDISGIFTGQLPNANPIAMRAKYKSGKTETMAVTKKFPASKQLPAGTKVSVLADNGTASASEALIGVLIDNGVIDYGDIYISNFGKEYLDFTGTAAKNGKTYGKGIMQSTFINFRTGEALKLTTAKIYWPKGETSIHDVGLTAGMGCKLVPAAWDVTYDDEQLLEALKIIYG